MFVPEDVADLRIMDQQNLKIVGKAASLALVGFFNRTLAEYDGIISVQPLETEILFKLFTVVDDASAEFRFFHAGVDYQHKIETTRWFKSIDATPKIMFSTSAFGYGVNIPNISTVVIISCPRSVSIRRSTSGRNVRNVLPCAIVSISL